MTQPSLPGVDVSQRAPEAAERQASLSQWFTPPELAAEIVEDVDAALAEFTELAESLQGIGVKIEEG